jgi:hypothetical protein
MFSVLWRITGQIRQGRSRLLQIMEQRGNGIAIVHIYAGTGSDSTGCSSGACSFSAFSHSWAK